MAPQMSLNGHNTFIDGHPIDSHTTLWTLNGQNGGHYPWHLVTTRPNWNSCNISATASLILWSPNWENPNSIYNDEHTRPQCDFLLYQQYDDYFALEGIDAANLRIYEMTGIKIDDIRDKNSIFTSKGREYSQEITCTTQANKIKVSLDNNKVPFAENMYSNEMLKKVSTLYLQDILLYCNEIESDIPELDYWIRRTISDE